jgi:hypothetical protein
MYGRPRFGSAPPWRPTRRIPLGWAQSCSRAGAAKRELKVAQALEAMPEVRSSFSAGEVSSSAVRVLMGAREAHPEAFSSQERALVEQAQTKGADELRRVVGEWTQSLDEEEASLRRAERLLERRCLDICSTPSGMVHLEGELDPESGEHVMCALQGIVDADLRAGGKGDLRSPAQRRADALTRVGVPVPRIPPPSGGGEGAAPPERHG